MAPLVHGARLRVRMWAMCRLEAAQAANFADLKQGPLSVTILRVPISPVSGSAKSSIQVTPRRFFTSSRAAPGNPMASVAILVAVTSQARLVLAQQLDGAARVPGAGA